MDRARSSSLSWPLCLLAAGLATVPASQAASQAAAQEEEAQTLPTITVEGEDASGEANYLVTHDDTAAKTELPIAETPQSVTVVTSEQLRDRPVRSVQEAVQYVPGVVGATFGADVRNDWIQIRGFAAQAQSYFADGLQLPANAFATWRLEPFTLDSISVLRGPSSVLFGASSPGGLINADTKRAEFADFGEAFASVNQFGHVRGGIDVNESAGDFAFRFVGVGRVGETEVDFTEDDGYAFAPSLAWRPTDRTSVEFYANVLADRTNGQNFLPYIGTEERAPYGRIERDLFTSEPGYDAFERDQWLVGYRAEHEFGNGLTAVQNLRYGELDIDFYTVYGVGLDGPPGNAELARGNFITTPHATLFNLDNRLAYQVETGPVAHDLLVGIEYKRYTLDDEQGFVAAPSLDLVDPVYGGAAAHDSRYILDEHVQNQVALYAQDAITFGRWSMLASGRVDFVDLSVDNELGDDYSSQETAFSGRLGALYTFDNGLAPYASVSRSFLPVLGRDSATDQPFEPETGLQYEAGIKYQPPGWNALFTASAFHLTRQNVPQADAAFMTRQVGEITAKGIELDVRADPIPGLQLLASATFMDIETTEGTPLDLGNVPTGTPEVLASAYADYTIQSGPLADLGFGAGVRYIGRSYADRANDLEVSSSVIVDAAIHYDLPMAEGASLALTATNLLDNKYVASCSSASACFYGEGRQVMLTVGYAW